MFRRLLHVRVYRLAGVIPLYEYRDPYDDTEKKIVKPPETGWERVRFLFQYRSDGYVSKEYISTIQIASCSFIISFMGAFIKGAMHSVDKFVMFNQQTKFVSAYEARRKMQDLSIFDGIKNGLKYGTKCCVFTTIFMLGTTIIAAYRDKNAILEYTLSAGIAGAIVRVYLGVMGTIVGFGVGAFLGTVVGTIVWVIGKLTGTTLSDTQEMLYKRKIDNDKKKSEFFRKLSMASYHEDLRNWLRELKGKFQYTLHNKDVRYVMQPAIVNDAEESSSKTDENDVKEHLKSDIEKDVSAVVADKTENDAKERTKIDTKMVASVPVVEKKGTLQIETK